MLSVDQLDLHVTVWPLAVVGEANFVAFARGVDNIVLVQGEEKAAIKLRVDHFSTLRLRFCDFLAAIFLQRSVKVNV